jgi:hypothetical protein
MRKVRLRTLEMINAGALMIVSGQNVKRLLEFGRRGPRKAAHGAGRSAALAIEPYLRYIRRHRAVRQCVVFQ